MSSTSKNAELTHRLVSIIEQARSHIVRSVNSAMVQAYWHIGREVVESEQDGQARADYGEALMRSVATALQEQFGRGFSYSNVKRMRQFYQRYPLGSPVDHDGKGATTLRLFDGETVYFPTGLSWSH